MLDARTELWTMEELAEFLRLSLNAVRKMIWRGQLPATSIVKIGRRVRLRAAVIRAWVERGAA
jgi:excisionase family DNA binding protein